MYQDDPVGFQLTATVNMLSLGNTFHMATPDAVQDLPLPAAFFPAPAKPPERFLGLLFRITSICTLNPGQSSGTVTMSLDGIPGSGYAQELVSLNSSLKFWASSLPSEWKPRRVSATPPLTVFWCPSYLTVWSAYWLARLEVLRRLAELAERPAQENGNPWPSAETTRAEQLAVVEEILAAVPFMIGKIGFDGRNKAGSEFRAITAVYATRCLYVAAQVPELPAQRSKWIADQLEYAGRECGIGHALRLKGRLGNVARVGMDERMLES